MSDKDIDLLPPSACPSGRHKVNIRVVNMAIEYKPIGVSNIIVYGSLDELPKKVKAGEFGKDDFPEVVESCCRTAAEAMGMEVNLYE
jgi:hypothetical protein